MQKPLLVLILVWTHKRTISDYCITDMHWNVLLPYYRGFVVSL